ncbi:MAG: ABC transporter permease [Acidimicrobiales bacterium]|jgi:peptide/nickel transport system permease protein
MTLPTALSARLEGVPEPEPEYAGGRTKSPWRLAAAEFLSSKIGVTGLVIVIFMVLFSFVGPVFYHTNQVTADLLARNIAPGRQYPLGTDTVGYDVLGRLMVAGQSSLEVGLGMAFICVVLGTLFGAVSGFVGGAADAVIMRVVDTFLAIPTILILILLAAIVTPSNLTVILILGFMSWPSTARLVRGEVLVIRTHDYVAASKMFGERPMRIVLRHVVRNVLSVLVVTATFAVANGILLLAALSFLGLGPPPPSVNWGGMLSTGINYIFDNYWWQIYPAGLCIVITVLGFNFLGDATREALDVRLRRP